MQGMSLIDIMLWDEPSQRTSMVRLHLQEGPGAVSFRQTRSRTVVVGGCGQGKTGSWCLTGTGFQSGKFLEVYA